MSQQVERSIGKIKRGLSALVRELNNNLKLRGSFRFPVKSINNKMRDVKKAQADSIDMLVSANAAMGNTVDVDGVLERSLQTALNDAGTHMVRVGDDYCFISTETSESAILIRSLAIPKKRTAAKRKPAAKKTSESAAKKPAAKKTTAKKTTAKKTTAKKTTTRKRDPAKKTTRKITAKPKSDAISATPPPSDDQAISEEPKI